MSLLYSTASHPFSSSSFLPSLLACLPLTLNVYFLPSSSFLSSIISALCSFLLFSLFLFYSICSSLTPFFSVPTHLSFLSFYSLSYYFPLLSSFLFFCLLFFLLSLLMQHTFPSSGFSSFFFLSLPSYPYHHLLPISQLFPFRHISLLALVSLPFLSLVSLPPYSPSLPALPMRFTVASSLCLEPFRPSRKWFPNSYGPLGVWRFRWQVFRY